MYIHLKRNVNCYISWLFILGTHECVCIKIFIVYNIPSVPSFPLNLRPCKSPRAEQFPVWQPAG